MSKGFAITSFILGVISIPLCFIPILGTLVSIGGLITGIIGIKRAQGALAIIGTVLSSLCLLGNIIFMLGMFVYFL